MRKKEKERREQQRLEGENREEKYEENEEGDAVLNIVKGEKKA